MEGSSAPTSRRAACARWPGLSLSGANAAVARHAAELRRETTGLIKARLDQAVADGQLAVGADTETLAAVLNAALVGMSVAAHDGARRAELRAMAQLAASVLPAGCST